MEDLLRKKLLYILHRGLIEFRLLAMSPEKAGQIHDLADALENIPNLMIAWNDSFLTGIERELKSYESRYPQGFHYSSILDWDEVPADI